MAKQMTDDELKAISDTEMRQAYGYWGGKLGNQRQKAEYYYLGLPKGDLSPPEIEGRSSVVSSDVRNTIESMLPQIMVKMVGGDSVVEFEPTKAGDEQAADLCTQYMNYLFFKKNNGHALTYTWAKDGLLQKVGVVKVWWDTRHEEKREEYKGLDEFELSQILDDEEIEPIEQNAYPDEEDVEQRQEAMQQMQAQYAQCEQAAQAGDQNAMMQCQQIQAQMAQIQAMPPKMLYDIAVKRVKTGGKVAIENVPPEEFLISRNAKSIKDARMVGQRVFRTFSELKSMGYPAKVVDNLTSDDAAASMNAERIERLSWDDENAYQTNETSSLDESQHGVWVTEMYLRVDYDGDGIAELRKITRAGNELLDNEVVDAAPYVSWCPVPLPHKFFGLSVADLCMDYMRIKTSVLRAYLDNLYLQVNGRYFAVENQCNLDDLLTSRPGGVVRVKNPAAVGRLDQGVADAAGAMNAIEYVDEAIENSTGWTKYSQGNNGEALNQTATGVTTITNRGDMRLDLIVRHFAEGMAELFQHMLKLVCQNHDKEQVIRLTGEWVPVDPREWRNQFDVVINVGLGVGGKEQQAAGIINMMQVQERAFQAGVATPENVYNAACELVKINGFKNADKFFTDPSKQPPKPPPVDPKIQLEQAKHQDDQWRYQAEMQLKMQESQMQAEVDRNREEMQAKQEMLKIEQQMQLEQVKAEYQMQMEQMRIAHDADVKLQIAKIDAEAKIIAAQISAANKPNAEGEAQGQGASSEALAMALEGFREALSQIRAPRQIVRGPDGRAQGIV